MEESRERGGWGGEWGAAKTEGGGGSGAADGRGRAQGAAIGAWRRGEGGGREPKWGLRAKGREPRRPNGEGAAERWCEPGKNPARTRKGRGHVKKPGDGNVRGSTARNGGGNDRGGTGRDTGEGLGD